MRVKGFTLVEMLVALGIMVIVSTILASLLVNQSGVFYKQNAVVNIGVSLNNTVSSINNYIRQASAVAGGYPESSPQYTTGQNTLVLKLLSVNMEGTINDVYDYVVVYKDSADNHILRLQVFPDPQSTRTTSNTVLTTLMDTIQFNYLDNNGNTVAPSSATSVKLILTLSYGSGGTGSSRTSETVTSLRNML